MRVLPQAVLNRIYAKHSEIDVDVVSHLCPNCRRIDVAVIEDRPCHIDQLEKMAANQEVCLVPAAEKKAVKAPSAPKGEAPSAQAKAPATPDAPAAPHARAAQDTAPRDPAPSAKLADAPARETARADDAAQAPGAKPQPDAAGKAPGGTANPEVEKTEDAGRRPESDVMTMTQQDTDVPAQAEDGVLEARDAQKTAE